MEQVNPYWAGDEFPGNSAQPPQIPDMSATELMEVFGFDEAKIEAMANAMDAEHEKFVLAELEKRK